MDRTVSPKDASRVGIDPSRPRGKKEKSFFLVPYCELGLIKLGLKFGCIVSLEEKAPLQNCVPRTPPEGRSYT